ncbi:hypothetical protein M3N64_07400 [Sporolactobacillus sp. CPB3-1]|uniref:LSM domain-containing protein n=1 Tax=Sporolactobacillus mangiferae TaxID=2940498 RepID=A0ABT0MA84_9BACL|nr:hypothetical protein [Sporolactobacillus mangiferae]MCL1631773.1 hypothetical protein [Sporolactobacillus mangiferae]
MAHPNYWEDLINQPVEIQCSDGSIHYGIVESFDQNNVYLKPLTNDQHEINENRGGNDERFYGFGFGPQAFLGGFAGGLLGVGLGSIIGVRPWPLYPPRPYYGPGPRPPYYGGYYGSGPGSFYY